MNFNDKEGIKDLLQEDLKDRYKFVFEKENGEKVDCEMIFGFYLPKKDKNYMLFTDNTYDINNNLKLYAYFSTSNDDSLYPVTEKNEFAMIEKVYKEVIKR